MFDSNERRVDRVERSENVCLIQSVQTQTLYPPENIGRSTL